MCVSYRTHSVIICISARQAWHAHMGRWRQRWRRWRRLRRWWHQRRWRKRRRKRKLCRRARARLVLWHETLLGVRGDGARAMVVPALRQQHALDGLEHWRLAKERLGQHHGQRNRRCRRLLCNFFHASARVSAGAEACEIRVGSPISTRIWVDACLCRVRVVALVVRGPVDWTGG